MQGYFSVVRFNRKAPISCYCDFKHKIKTDLPNLIEEHTNCNVLICDTRNELGEKGGG